MVFKWLDRGWIERRLKAWSVQWSGRLPHFSFPNPFSTGMEGRGKWFLFGRLGCLFSEPAEFCSPAVPLTWLLRLRMSLFSLWFISCHHREHLLITPSSYSIRCISPETHTCHLPPPLRHLADVKMILRPGKHFMFRTQISLGKLSLPGQFSCLAKHLKGSIRKKIIPSSVLNVHDSELALSICHGAMLPPRLQVINWQQKVMRNEI